MNYSDKINRIKISSEKKYGIFPFYKDGRPLEEFSVKWGMTFKKAGSMRFRWNENNQLRNEMFQKIIEENNLGEKKVVPVELIHSLNVEDVINQYDTLNLQKDGIITENKKLIPCVTVADCMPLFLCDIKQKVFGVVHSGWKGTGIIGKAIELAEKKYGSKPENICVAVGPHIRKCCYVVNEERAEYFKEKFCPECVEVFKEEETLGNPQVKAWNNGNGILFRLSLEKANLYVLENEGIKAENIVAAENCTCCDEMFGSNRRETSFAENSGKFFDRTRCFTVQAAFTVCTEQSD